MLKQILEKLKVYRKSFNEEKISKAVDLIKDKKAEILFDQDSALEMIDYLVPLKPDDDTIVAGLLHKFHIKKLLDEDMIKDEFGEDVLNILLGVKNLEALNYVENDKAVQIEDLRNMILVLAKDIRVILVALACRLHKMHNLNKFINNFDIKIYSAETLDLYVPLCARLGMYTFKSVLEDLAFKYVNPKEYENIFNQVEQLRNKCDISISFIKSSLERFLRSKDIKAEIFGRIKNIYSIYRKLKSKGLTSIKDLYDIFAMRIILPAKLDEEGHEIVDHLYAVLGLIHSEWKPISKRFRDYLAVPKPNGYRSLHTVVLGLAPKDVDQPVEIQIRDSLMHRDAEYGIASHWIYKEAPDRKINNLQIQIDFIKGLEQIRNEFDLDYDVIKEVEINIFKDRIFVLTPRGEVKDLPLGSTPIDFAYEVHTDVGNKCVMAKVNGKAVPLNYKLNNNDVIEIVTKKDATPKFNWLSLVKTSLAKNKIKAWFNATNKDFPAREVKKIKSEENRADFINKIINLKKLRREKKAKFIEKSKKFILENHILVGGEDGLPLKIAACCNPKMSIPIIGYVTRGNRITIHRDSCHLLDHLDKDRVIFADWK